MEDRIAFWGTKGSYGFLSNFSLHGFALDGYMWYTSEHFYQAYKFTPGGQKFMSVNDAASPGIAKKIGGSFSGESIREDWKEYRLVVMRRALKAKFTQNLDIREQLIATGDTMLVEDSPVDYFWGIGADGSGSNMLGILLMELRNELLNEVIFITSLVNA